jgi:anti-sigma B factor antagonist
MHINVKHQADSSIVHIDGDFLSEPDQDRFRQRIKEIVNQGGKHIIVDLSQVNHINSCGLGSLVCGLVAAKKAGGELVLMSPGDKVQHLFELTKLNTVFHIFPTVASALAQSHMSHS